MKDETKGVLISKFVGLGSKMFSFVFGDKEEKEQRASKQ